MLYSTEALENDTIRRSLVNSTYTQAQRTATALVIVRLAFLLLPTSRSPISSGGEGLFLFLADLLSKLKTNPAIDMAPIKQALLRQSNFIHTALCSEQVRSNG